MRIVNLMEDTKGAENCAYEHGLSFYVETGKHKVLVDTGATGAFIQNAKVLGIDLSEVDTVIISHGHYDHGGGIMDFIKINDKAVIYIQESATGEFYNASTANGKYIGMDKDIPDLPQVRLIDGDMRIDDELSIFTDVAGRRLWPKGNELLKRKVSDTYVQDEFEHEQYLVISEGDTNVLISGCAHNGILNILDKYLDIYEDMPTKVISGFHMMKKSDYTEEDEFIIRATARELRELDTTFYTGHCTGEYALNILKSMMGDKLIEIHSGEEIV
ncbi:MAG: MBL fold metallo-hydrolase [Lachnospira sp.]|nr:MBL fold metallo-hydrolase [Lachnospira sp.]